MTAADHIETARHGPGDGGCVGGPAAAGAAEAAPTVTRPGVRVVVVTDDVRGTVHGMTTSNAEATQWCRDLAAKHPDCPLPARQFVAVIDVADGTWWDD